MSLRTSLSLVLSLVLPGEALVVSFTSSHPTLSTIPRPPHQRTPRALVRSSPPLLAIRDSDAAPQLDSEALLRYSGAVTLQMALITAFFAAVDAAADASGVSPLPWQAVCFIFFAMSLRSRTFSPLNNQRPNPEDIQSGKPTPGFGDRIMPSWTPPGVLFPIMWILIIAPLRAYSSALVYEATGGHLLNPALLALMFHLSIGDTWNTINNVERRLGAAVPGVACVWGSVVFAATRYNDVSPQAGTLLGLTVVWITVAGTLVADTWRVNNEVESEPLYPYKNDQIKTRFWFEEA